MRQIVQRRMDDALVAPDALNRAVDMSGGVTRELVRIIRAAAVRASVTKANAIKSEHVDHAVNALRGEYSDSLTRPEQLEILRAVHKSKKLLWNDDRPMLDLMHNLMILKYPNGPGWYEVNPIVKQLIGV
jgi:thiamine monophosphate kinase